MIRTRSILALALVTCIAAQSFHEDEISRDDDVRNAASVFDVKAYDSEEINFSGGDVAKIVADNHLNDADAKRKSGHGAPKRGVHGGWSYHGDTGPSHWPSMYKTCGGESQSPINVRTPTVVRSSAKEHVVTTTNFDKVDPSSNYTLTNNGHSIQMNIQSKDFYLTKVGGSTYTPIQLHFHWGREKKVGSEHTVDGKAAEMEMHVVHVNTKYPRANATAYTDGLLVIGSFIHVSFYTTSGLQNITKALNGGNLDVAGSSIKIQPFALQEILPEKVAPGCYYLYKGSLTTPPCSEVVTWVLLKRPMKVAKRNLKMFRRVLTDSGSINVDNFRPVQSVNDRTVYAPYEPNPWREFSRLNLALSYQATKRMG